MIKHRQKILINANIEKSWHFLSDLQRSLIFDKYYKGCEEVIPYYWLPKWSGDLVEPSARVLKN